MMFRRVVVALFLALTLSAGVGTTSFAKFKPGGAGGSPGGGTGADHFKPNSGNGPGGAGSGTQGGVGGGFCC